MDTITLHLQGDTWLATHDSQAIVDLFGTDTIPTPYNAMADPEMVLADIAALNPDKRVIIK